MTFGLVAYVSDTRISFRSALVATKPK
jgi:hypothetical protein